MACIGTENLAIGAASLPDKWRATSPSPPCATAATWLRPCPPRRSAPQLRPVIDAGLPFHPGAAAALRSLGYDLPARAVER